MNVVHPLSWRSWRFRSVAALVLLVLVMRLVWGWYAHRLLRVEQDAIRRRGEPVVPEDVRFEPLAQSQNAWTVLMNAAAAQAPGVDSPRNGNDDYKDYPP